MHAQKHKSKEYLTIYLGTWGDGEGNCAVTFFSKFLVMGGKSIYK